MGSCAGKASQTEVVQPQTTRQQRISHQLQQFMRLEHPLNVNHKYTAQFTIIPDQFVGEGIRRTNQYSTRLSRAELIAKRAEFWETRIEGRKESWQVIKAACETDEQTALAILSAGELTLVNTSLQLIFDNQGQKYDVPVFCINEPIAFSETHSSEAGINLRFDRAELKVKIRSAKFQSDLTFDLPNTTSIEHLKSQLLQKDTSIQKIRLFYGGRELQDHHQLGNYNLPAETVLLAFCTVLPS